MASFSVAIVANAAIADWTDPPFGELPSRLTTPRHPARYYRVRGPLPIDVELKALVGGAEVADAGLSGRTFSWTFASIGSGPVPGFTTTGGSSFHATVRFRAFNSGFWLVRVTLPQSGNVLVGLNVEP